VLTGGLAGWHFRVKGEDSRTQRCGPGAAPPGSRHSTCHQHPDGNTPLPIRPNLLLKKGDLYFLFAVASHKTGVVDIEFDEGTIQQEKLKQTIEAAGFDIAA
jgi:hypothetical protein